MWKQDKYGSQSAIPAPSCLGRWTFRVLTIPSVQEPFVIGAIITSILHMKIPRQKNSSQLTQISRALKKPPHPPLQLQWLLTKKEYLRVILSPHPHLHLLIYFYNNHSDWKRWNLIVILTCISLVAKEVECFFIISLAN